MLAEQYLKKILEKGKIPHVLLFCGNDAKELEKCAYAFACDVLKSEAKNHPDLFLYHPEGKLGMHSVEQIKKISQESALFPLEAQCKIFIIHEVDRCLPTSSNALLKTLEEPISHSIFLLTSARREHVLPTILSRSVLLNFVHGKKKRDPLIDQFAHLLLHAHSLKEIEAFAAEIENKRKEREKELLKGVPKEASPKEREQLEETIYAEGALQYQRETSALLETIYLLGADQVRIACGLPPKIGKKSLPEMKVIEEHLKKTRIAIERGVPLTQALGALFYQLL